MRIIHDTERSPNNVEQRRKVFGFLYSIANNRPEKLTHKLNSGLILLYIR